MLSPKLLRILYSFNRRLAALGLTALPPVRIIKRLLFNVFIHKFSGGYLYISISGGRLYVPINAGNMFEYVWKPFEPYTSKLFSEAVRPGSTVLDIGAQFGYYTIMAGLLAGRNGLVYAFEPVPENFAILERNVRLNRLGNVILVQRAVSDRKKTVMLHLYKDSSSHGMYARHDVGIRGVLAVEAVTVDSVLSGRPVDVIKMDIEGHEPFALIGMKQTIAVSSRLVLFTEFNPYFLRMACVEPRNYLDQLKDVGFRISVIDERRRQLVPLEDYIFPDTTDATFYVNLYCVKQR